MGPKALGSAFRNTTLVKFLLAKSSSMAIMCILTQQESIPGRDDCIHPDDSTVKKAPCVGHRGWQFPSVSETVSTSYPQSRTSPALYPIFLPTLHYPKKATFPSTSLAS